MAARLWLAAVSAACSACFNKASARDPAVTSGVNGAASAGSSAAARGTAGSSDPTETSGGIGVSSTGAAGGSLAGPLDPSGSAGVGISPARTGDDGTG